MQQRYKGCFTFGDVRRSFLILLVLLAVLRLNAQSVCIRPERIPAIRLGLNAPEEQGVDRKGPWYLSEPVAVKYGLSLKGPVDERLDSSCAQFAAEAQWKKSWMMLEDSLLADIALAVSPAYAVRVAKRWTQDPCERERDAERIRQAEESRTWQVEGGWSQKMLLDARLAWSGSTTAVAAAPALTALVAPSSVLGTNTTTPSPPVTFVVNAEIGNTNTSSKPQPPTPKPAPQKIKYVVKSGDSLWKIAQKFPGTTEAELVRLNKGKTTIYPGQILWIPK